MYDDLPATCTCALNLLGRGGGKACNRGPWTSTKESVRAAHIVGSRSGGGGASNTEFWVQPPPPQNRQRSEGRRGAGNGRGGARACSVSLI